MPSLVSFGEGNVVHVGADAIKQRNKNLGQVFDYAKTLMMKHKKSQTCKAY